MVQLFLKLVLGLHLGNDIAQVEALSVRDLFLANLLVCLDFEKLMLQCILHGNSGLLVISNSPRLDRNNFGFLCLRVIHLIFHFAHVRPTLGFLLHLINLYLAHGLLILFDLFFELFISLALVELLADLGLLRSPFFEVLDLLDFLLAALGINLILDGVLSKLFLDPLLLVNLELVLAQAELFLLLFKLFAEHLLTLLGTHFLLSGFLMLAPQGEFVESGPLVELVIEAADHTDSVLVRVNLNYSKIIPQTLS